jgi:AraC-like DNA-binding protein
LSQRACSRGERSRCFRINVTSLTNTVTVLGADWDALVERLKSHVTAGRYEESAKTLEEFLIQQALVRTYDLKLIQTAAKLLHYTKGQYRVSELADCQLSTRQLERKFQSSIGTSPKTFARTLRFQEAQRRLMFDPDAELTGWPTNAVTSTRPTLSRTSRRSQAKLRPNTRRRCKRCRRF